MLAEIKYALLLKEKEDPEVPNTDKRRRNLLSLKQQYQLCIQHL